MEGQDLKVVSTSRAGRFPFLKATLLVLSFLLVGSIAGLVYISLSNQHSCQSKPAETVDVEADVTVKSGNEERKEKITYSHNSRVAYYRGADGSFDVDDFAKGIHITKSPSDGVCYLIPVGVDSQSDVEFENLLRTHNNGEMSVNGTKDVTVEVLPGKVEDTSFIAEGAHKECTNGYRWMVVTGVDQRVDDKRVKRATCRRCYLISYRGRLYLLCYSYRC